jgi:hypothetical protein
MEEIKGFLECSSLPGLYLIVKSKHIIVRLIWFISVVLLFYPVILQSSDLILDYFNHDVISNINIYDESESEFPAVSFCITMENNKTIPSLNESMIYCNFNQLDCDSNQFEVYTFYFNDLIQICYRFSTQLNLKKQNRPGSDAGLSVHFVLPKLYKNIVTKQPEIYKMTIYIQNASNLFRRDQAYSIDPDIKITPGIHFIQIEREFVQKMPKPFNECVKQIADNNNNISNLFIKNNFTYLQKDCLDFCVEDIMILNCSCNITNNYGLNKLENCLNNNETNLECIGDLYMGFRNRSLKIPQHCFDSCPKECDSINYKIYPSYVGQISKQLLNELKLNESLQENIVLVNLYYPRLDYILSNEIQKLDGFLCIAALGGTLSLYLGVNFFTLIEIVATLLEFVLNQMSKQKIAIIPENLG